jgi:hypothetical protein
LIIVNTANTYGFDKRNDFDKPATAAQQPRYGFDNWFFDLLKPPDDPQPYVWLRQNRQSMRSILPHSHALASTTAHT